MLKVFHLKSTANFQTKSSKIDIYNIVDILQ